MDPKKEKKNLKVFGYGLVVILSFIVFKVRHDHGGYPAFAVLIMACAVALFFVTLLRYESLRPFYKRWMKGAHFIGNTITRIVLTTMFYGVFGPVGLLLRLMKKDLLEREIDRSVDSYWIKRDQGTYNKSDYLRQF